MIPTNEGRIRLERPLVQRLTGFATLFTSTGTLVCCVLPASVAALAGGSAVIALTSTFPWLIPLSRHKDWIFLVAGLMLLFNGFLLFRPKGTVACAVTGGSGCEVAGRFTTVMFWSSVVIVGIGVFISYAIVPILRWLET
ncbi:MAG: hypothetical protein IH874_05080 [Candidatus Dadabacteria bacterium]|nr:hypothetical protein [Candidatus Dadabacteria bacterium]